MSFLSVLSKINGFLVHGLTVIAPAEPAIAAIPTFGPMFDTVFRTVVMLEHLIPGEKQGAVKKPIAIQIIQANNPTVDTAAVGTKIDDLIKLLNSFKDISST